MTLKSDSWPRIFRRLFLILLYYVACLVVLNTYMDRHGFRGYEDRYGFAKMMDYTAEKPFCYRVLTPLVVNGIMELIPDRSFVKLEKDLLHDSGFLRYADTTGVWDVKISARQHLTYLYLFLCLFAAVFFLRYLTGLVYPGNAALMDFAPVIAFLLYPLTFAHGTHMYDFPELLFLLAGIIFILKNNRLGYYLVLPLAVINKETGAILALFFLLLKYKEISRPRLMVHLAVQLIIAAGIIIYLRVLFSDNPEPMLANRLWSNLLFWVNPKSYIKVYESYAPLLGVPRPANLIFLFLAGFAVLYKWREKPDIARKLLIIPGLVMIPLFLYYGYRDEIRVFAPIFPAFYLCAVHTVSTVYRGLTPEKIAGRAPRDPAS